MIDIKNSDFNDVEWPENVDLVVTSPPYKDEDNFTHSLIENFGRKSYAALKPNSLLFMNFGHLANFKERPFESAMILKNIGFEWVDTITWVKNHYRPLQGNKRLNNLTEFIFMMAKGTPDIDRLSIGVPYADKSNIKRWKGTEGKDLKCGGNVWNIPYETVTDKSQKLHNDRFPIGLPINCIKLSGIEVGSLVVDPFSGSGTTALACSQTGMNFWGTEINKTNYNISKIRLNLI
jgi:site-specific DNA-methyltransferase (adenine-specific)